MLHKEGLAELRERLAQVGGAANAFFDKAQPLQDANGQRRDIWNGLLTPQMRNRETKSAQP